MSVADRYDQNARLYERWWAPVLASTAARLLDRCDAFARATLRERGSLEVVDLGTGTGALAIDAASRWPGASITAVDVARGMLAVAADRAEARLGTRAADMRWIRADADRLPMADASVDLVVSSFVLQLVTDRQAVLGEIRRVLRPGGRLWFVTWISGRDRFAPADEFDEAVYDLNIEEEEYEDDPRAGDFTSASAAERELRRADFQRIRVEREILVQPWTMESYVGYKVEYDELDLFADLDEATGERLKERVRERLAALDPSDFHWRVPVVFAKGDRPR